MGGEFREFFYSAILILYLHTLSNLDKVGVLKNKLAPFIRNLNQHVTLEKLKMILKRRGNYILIC